MITVASPRDTKPVLLDVGNVILHTTSEQFDQLCADNPDLRLELTKDGELIVMAPAFPISGERNGELFGQVYVWNRQRKLGRVFDSSTGYDFTTMGGGKLSPDVSWIEKSRLEGISLEQFCPVVPDFVIELRSTTDKLNQLQTKMLGYQRLGVRLGLLINPQDRQVEVYRLGQEPDVLKSPLSVSCEEVMLGFILSMNEIW
ncbi:MAG: Uma2 family endonuclease [Microcystis aeruginosa G11-01]|nr:Uma2 family endonuclease [Microcystis aeruginosa G11-01]